MARIDSFDFKEGMRINGRYEVLERLGDGCEGEVYLVKELSTGIERAAKFFYPHRNEHGRTSKYNATKLHKLRRCHIIIQYATQETYYHNGQPIDFLISEYIDGELLSEYVKRQPGKQLNPFAALHLLYALATGVQELHQMHEYHGDLHTQNIIVERSGLRFDLKLLDLYKQPNGHLKDEVVDLVQIFYEVLGGKRRYAKQPPEVKEIICGLKRSLILKKFPSVTRLIAHLETMRWS